MTWQGVSEAECYDNRSVIAQIVRIKDRLTAVEQNVDPTLRTDLEAAIAELTALENTVANVQTAVGTNTGNIEDLQEDLNALTTSTTAALALKADAADVDADLELKADKTQLTDGSVTKVGTSTVGTDVRPIKLVAGVPTQVARDVINKGTSSTTQTILGILEFDDWPKIKKNILYDDVAKTSINTTDGAKWIAVNNIRPDNYMMATGRFIFNVKNVLVVAFDFAGNGASIVKKGGTTGISVAVRPYKTSAGEFISVYVRIPQGSGNNITAHLLPFFIGIQREGKPAIESALYEDVTYDSKTIPNIANYANYPWYILPEDTWTEIPAGTVIGP